MMKRILLLLLVFMMFSSFGWSQTDYSIITFKSKIHYYKKPKPSLKSVDFNKEDIKRIVDILGNDHLTSEDLEEITNQIWLAFIDPKKFDFVYKDLAIRTLPNWGVKNAVGKIVLEPNPFLSYWTEEDGELQYFQKALYLILVQYELMGYAEDGKHTKVALQKMLYTKGLALRPVYKSDYTNSYLQYTNKLLANKDVSIIVANGNYQFAACKNKDVGELTSLFEKMSWNYIAP